MAEITFEEAAHLLRRMGFGGPPDEIADLARRGREGAVDFLMNYRDIDNTALEGLLARSFDFSNPFDPARFNGAEIRRWWLTRMIHTRRQFEEKLTLFWHNYFATSDSKAPDILMFTQNQTLRANSLGRFDDLLLAVARDPAMLIWLDGVSNVLGSPNENFARELQELFSMGITDAVTGEPNYTEQDVKEIARAFTGWKFRPPRSASNLFDFPFFVNPIEHDSTMKTIYGINVNFGGEDVISLIAERRATARFLVKKLFEFFVYPLAPTAEGKATIERFADIYVNRDHSIAALVRAIFISDEFFSERARFALVKSPVELIVGAIRMTGATHNPGSAESGRTSNLPAILSALMGQDMFNPPDVAGWELNLGWINTAALLLRYNFADLLSVARTGNPQEPGIWVTHEQLKSFTRANAKKTVKRLLSLLGPLSVSPATTQALREYLTTNDVGERVGFVPDDLTIDKKIRGLMHQVMCLPAFQMN
jgi:uncharacterized protein (DUF1800 family)